MPWGESNYVNPPFGSIIHEGKKKGPTAWARKAIAEAQQGKRVVLVYPIDKWVLMLLAAGATVRNLGDVRWLATEDGSAGKGTGRHIAEFCSPHPRRRVAEGYREVEHRRVDGLAAPPHDAERAARLGDHHAHRAHPHTDAVNLPIALTPRQLEVAALAAKGHGHKQIALALGISPGTVRNHIITIADKIGGDAPPLRRVMRWALERTPPHPPSAPESIQQVA
jgi:DNA-binding CsgD family transcriptional regulator